MKPIDESQSSLLTNALLAEEADIVEENVTFLSIFRFSDST